MRLPEIVSLLRVTKPPAPCGVRRLTRCYSIEEVAKVARRRLPLGSRACLESGGEGEYTLDRNRAAFDALEFVPRQPQDVSHVDTGRTVLGRSVPPPFTLSPIAAPRMFHHEGALAVARAAAGPASLTGSPPWPPPRSKTWRRRPARRCGALQREREKRAGLELPSPNLPLTMATASMQPGPGTGGATVGEGVPAPATSGIAARWRSLGTGIGGIVPRHEIAEDRREFVQAVQVSPGQLTHDAFAVRCQANPYHPAVVAIGYPLDQPSELGTVDELRRTVRAQEQVASEIAHGGRHASRVSLDRHQQLMLNMGHTRCPGLIVAPALEAAQGNAELQQPLEVLLGQLGHGHLPGLPRTWRTG